MLSALKAEYKAAPRATASSGLPSSLAFFPNTFFTDSLIIGTLVDPPTSITSSISSDLMFLELPSSLQALLEKEEAK